MNPLKKILDGVVGAFVCEDGGIYKGQCPQLPKYLARQTGVNWTGATGHGRTTVDTLVALGGYYGEGRDYRICSCEVAGSEYGHTWVEIKENGEWKIYEQNIKRTGAKTANFGCGTVYSVTTVPISQRGSWRTNIRYAGHPAIDAYVRDHQPAPAPAPKKSNEEIADEVIAGKWGNAPERYERLEAAGYDAQAIQAIVNAKMAQTSPQAPNTAQFKVGDTVVPTKLVDYNGTPLVQYDPSYTITEINGDRAVLSARGAIWAAMNTANIRRA